MQIFKGERTQDKLVFIYIYTAKHVHRGKLACEEFKIGSVYMYIYIYISVYVYIYIQCNYTYIET